MYLPGTSYAQGSVFTSTNAPDPKSLLISAFTEFLLLTNIVHIYTVALWHCGHKLFRTIPNFQIIPSGGSSIDQMQNISK